MAQLGVSYVLSVFGDRLWSVCFGWRCELTRVQYHYLFHQFTLSSPSLNPPPQSSPPQTLQLSASQLPPLPTSHPPLISYHPPPFTSLASQNSTDRSFPVYPQG